MTFGTCEICGVVVTAHPGGGRTPKTCGPECRRERYNRRRRLERKVGVSVGTCRICGGPFTRLGRTRARAKYCGQACAHAADRIRQRLARGDSAAVQLELSGVIPPARSPEARSEVGRENVSRRYATTRPRLASISPGPVPAPLPTSIVVRRTAQRGSERAGGDRA